MSVAGIALLSFAAGHADSGECVKHAPLPVTAEGISIGEDGDVADAAGTLYVCNNGSTVGPTGDVPLPAKGHAQVGGHIDQADPTKSEGHVYVDGDQNNNVDGGPGCT